MGKAHLRGPGGAGNDDDDDDDGHQDLLVPSDDRTLKITNVKTSIPAQVPITMKDGSNVIDTITIFLNRFIVKKVLGLAKQLK